MGEAWKADGPLKNGSAHRDQALNEDKTYSLHSPTIEETFCCGQFVYTIAFVKNQSSSG